MVVVVAAGCAAGPSNAHSTASESPGHSVSAQATTPAAGDATLTGTLREYGGPMDPRTNKQTLDGVPMPDVAVTAAGSDGTRTVVRTDHNGGFSLRLAAGRYTLSATCSVITTVVVAPGTTVHHDMICAVP